MKNQPFLLVATPCYCGSVDVRYMESIMHLMQLCSMTGIKMSFTHIPFDSLIPRARNVCVTRFMQKEEYTHMIFIDADIQFDPKSVIKMIEEDKDIICGAYPKKILDYEAIKQFAPTSKDMTDLLQSVTKFAINVKKDSQPSESGVIEVLDGPTGFMLIKKEAIKKLIDAYPDTEYKNDINAYRIPDAKYYDLFQSKVFDNRYLSEDYGFCRLWQKIGGRIFVDLTTKLNHIGPFVFPGDPITYFNKRSLKD